MELTLPGRWSLHRPAQIILIHTVLVCAGYFAAFALRFDGRIPLEYAHGYWVTLPILVATRLIAFDGFGLHRRSWRHAGIDDLRRLTAASVAGSLAFVLILAALGWLSLVPPAVPFLELAFAFLLGGGPRFATRMLREDGFLGTPDPNGRRTLVIGAGEGGAALVRQVQIERRNLQIVGLVDDNPDIRGMVVHGVPVVGATHELATLVRRYRAALLVIAIPSAAGEPIRRIVERCKEAGVEFKIVPSMQDLLAGRARIAELRDVQIDDLLGREPVRLETGDVVAAIEGTTVLVTGGAGSIGSELARQIARARPTRLVLFERAESPLYFVHLEIAKANPDIDVVPVIADITSLARVEQVFRRFRPDFVFHTAAYKHVPLLEANPVEALRNNVVGTLRVAEAAARYGTWRFVLISSDKAVRPRSTMGATKRLAERIVSEHPTLIESATDFRVVRFGNVLGSDGSVVPLFRRQLQAGGPLTITHPDVARYFMTIPEAVQLVLKAAVLPEAAERIAILEMGAPVRIVDLAEQMIRLAGLTPHRDVELVFTGLRPGEKLGEELVSEGEQTVPTTVDKIRLITRSITDGDPIAEGLARLIAALGDEDSARALAALHTLVPEYVDTLETRPVWSTSSRSDAGAEATALA
jgi:FlaA1/EpsC-like NDP-sugar epimerase